MSSYQKGKIKFKNILEKVIFYTEQDTKGCWNWLGNKDKNGYGKTSWDRKGFLAHRLSYLHFHGSLTPGLHIDHLCKNTSCVNPAHLEEVSLYENVVIRGVASATSINIKKTHCKYGHAFTPENIGKFYVVNPKPTWRRCRQCGIDREREKRRVAKLKRMKK